MTLQRILTVRASDLLLLLLLGLTGISGSEPEVICTISNPAVLGGTVTLTCELILLHVAIEQLTWQKNKDNIPKNIAAQSKKYGVKIQPSFHQHVSIKGTELNRSSITISNLKLEDEAHYICIFNVFPHGSFKGKIYLPVSAVPPNEVVCSNNGMKLLNIKVQPEEHHKESIITENADGNAISVFKFKVQDLDKKLSCVFQPHLASRKSRNAIDTPSLSNKGPEEIVFLNCSISGKTSKITWENEGDPVFITDTESRISGIVNVASVRGYLKSNLLAQKSNIICNIVSKDTDKGMADSNGPMRISIVRIAIVLLPCILLTLPWVLLYRCHQNKHMKSRPDQALTPMKPSNTLENKEPQTPPESIRTSTPGSSVSKRKPSIPRHRDADCVARPLFPM